MRGRERMEQRFGPPGSGAPHVAIGGQALTVHDAMARLGIAFDGCRAIDAFEVGPSHFAVRYYDPEEQRVVVYEFDGEFRYVAEMRVHIAEWVGDEALTPGGEDPGEIVTLWTSR